MFGHLPKRFQSIFRSLKKAHVLTEKNLSDAVEEVRLALLDADVSYRVVKKLMQEIKSKVLGEKRLVQVSAREQFIAIVHEELEKLMGAQEATLNLDRLPSVLMLCGLQGSGKTTQAAKLGHYLKKLGKQPLLVACDLQRPAAIDQLERLGCQSELAVFVDRDLSSPVAVAKEALRKARREMFDVVILDTAGRLHVDQRLMEELKELKKEVDPHEILFVANAAMGQDAVKAAAAFNEEMEITGTVLTMLDGATRAGAALSICEETGKPLKFEGIGEKVSDFQLFNPQSMTDRMLGMGDVINLVRQAKEHVNQESMRKVEKKFRQSTFSFFDFLEQIRTVKKMGSFQKLFRMMPGMQDMAQISGSDRKMRKLESMILSMTVEERLGVTELIPMRRFRIARGCGLSIDEVNEAMKTFKRVKSVMKKMCTNKKEGMKLLLKMTSGKGEGGEMIEEMKKAFSSFK